MLIVMMLNEILRIGIKRKRKRVKPATLLRS